MLSSSLNFTFMCTWKEKGQEADSSTSKKGILNDFSLNKIFSFCSFYSPPLTHLLAPNWWNWHSLTCEIGHIHVPGWKYLKLLNECWTWEAFKIMQTCRSLLALSIYTHQHWFLSLFPFFFGFRKGSLCLNSMHYKT